MPEVFDVIIVGGGITGTSLMYMLSRFTGVKSILLLEKYDKIAPLNSNSRSNSQTLHFGDIETNYSLEKIRKVNRVSTLTLKYCMALPERFRNSTIQECQTMVLAVGKEESEQISKIYDSGIREIFPTMSLLNKNEINELEPNVVAGRDPSEQITGLTSGHGYMVDFGKLSETFVEDATKNDKVEIKVVFNHKVIDTKKTDDYYTVRTDKGEEFKGRFIDFSTGTYSLYFAKKMGLEQNLSILNIGGGFYNSRRVLKGKVYRFQHSGIPFAAIHADPDINDPNVTRFGPTVKVPLSLEKGKRGTFMDYVKSFDFDLDTLKSLKNIFFEKNIRKIIRQNFVYDIPGVGKRSFMKHEVNKIIPTLRINELKFAPEMGGIRPQIIDERTKKFAVGDDKIKGEGLTFNITPSPGESACLGNALVDAMDISKYLNLDFGSEGFTRSFGIEPEKIYSSYD